MGLVCFTWISTGRLFLVRDNSYKMPTDMVSYVVSTGLGVSVVAGILSGVCYVLAFGSKSRKKSNRKTKSQHCDVCGEYFRSIDHILGGDSTVTCSKCQTKVCQKRCAREQQDGWICKNCLRPPESWLQGILYAFQPVFKGKTEERMEETVKALEENKSTKIKEQVQDFIEKLVNSLLGQNIDDANVTKLYQDEQYLPLSGQQSPCTAHAALKQLIEKLLQEVLNMPALQKPQDDATTKTELNNRTYEDLLATAILNKVVSNSQIARPSSSAASISSRLSNSSNLKEDKEYFFGEETLDNKWKNNDLETTSASSIEDWLQSDSSFGSKKYVDRVTLTIKQDIEEVSQISESEEDEDNDQEYFRSRSSIWSDDEPNWFLQKRQFQGTHSPVPVPMLVPNPTTEAKVLIGDKEIDETSDLSDVESEFGEAEIVPARHSLLINSKTVIGGKNVIQNGLNGTSAGSESESSADSGVKEVDREHSTYDESEFMEETLENPVNIDESTDVLDGPIFVAKADIHIDDDNVEDASLLSVYSNTEQEAEYTEQYASLPRKIEKKPQPAARSFCQKTKDETKINEIERRSIDRPEDKQDNICNEDESMVQIHFSGNYSKREKEKWKNAIEMKNNPYSKENIEKRIKRSNSGAGSIFGPDYYAKLASSPSGTKSTKPTEVKGPAWPSDKFENQETSYSDEEKETEKYISKTYIASEETKDIYRAEPVIIINKGEVTVATYDEPPAYTLETHPFRQKSIEGNEDPEIQQKMPVPEQKGSLEYIAEVTSDSDLSYVNYYDVENSQVYKKTSGQTSTTANTGFIKNSKSQKTTNRLERTPSLKRFKSESDLYDHPEFSSQPKVLPQKRDNTLISKIYKVLSKSDLMEPPTFKTQLSAPGYTSRSYSDDDKDRNKQHHSSQEALSSIKDSSNTMTVTKQMSLSSEDEFSDQSSFYSEYRLMRNANSSTEDLLSIDEQDRKKKDNTLISKIYQQPNVRHYAFTKRQEIPIVPSVTRNSRRFSSDKIIEEIPKAVQPSIQQDQQPQQTKGVTKEKTNNELDVNELAKKRIVHTILDKISYSNVQSKSRGSKNDVNGISGKRSNGDTKSDTDEEHITTSVRDLMRKFENNLGKNQVVSSLTARSLSRHTRKPL